MSNFFWPHLYRFILLKDPHIAVKSSSLSGSATNSKNETFDIKLETDFNRTDPNDNPFSSIVTAIGAYFWIDGDWVQRNHFDFWAVDVFALLANFLIITILQNMLISIMG